MVCFDLLILLSWLISILFLFLQKIYLCMKTEKKLLPTVSLSDRIILQSVVSEEQVGKYFQPHRMELGCFWIVNSGKARISINMMEYDVIPHSIVTILPNSIICIADHTNDFRCEIIAFSPRFIHDMDLIRQIIANMETISSKPVVMITPEEIRFVKELHTTFAHIYQRTQERGSNNKGLLQNLLLSFFYGICSIYDKYRMESGKAELSRKEEIVRDYLSLVFKHYDKERRVSYYASRLCITPTYLNAVVKDVRGVSASKIISDAVTLYAKSALKSSTDTIQQIADALNFPNASFFAKFFKRETGISPTEFRELGRS